MLTDSRIVGLVSVSDLRQAVGVPPPPGRSTATGTWVDTIITGLFHIGLSLQGATDLPAEDSSSRTSNSQSPPRQLSTDAAPYRLYDDWPGDRDALGKGVLARRLALAFHGVRRLSGAPEWKSAPDLGR